MRTTRWALSAGLVLTCVCSADPPAGAGSPPTGAPAATDGPPVDEHGARYLWPRLEKGDRVMLVQTSEKSRRGNMKVSVRVTVDVIDKVDDEVVLRWKVGEIQWPSDMPESARQQLTAQLGQVESPDLELVVREDVGLEGVRNWETAAAQTIEITERLMKPTAEKNPESFRKAIQMLKDMMSTREGAESMLLKQVRGYFDGAYFELAPGTSHTEEVSVPFPFGDVGEVAGERLVRFEAIDPARSHLQTLSIDLTMDPEATKQAIDSLIKGMAESMGAEKKGPPPIQDYDSLVRLRWTLDNKLGWPSEVEHIMEQTVNGQTTRERYTWKLIEGPTPVAGADTPAELEPKKDR